MSGNGPGTRVMQPGPFLIQIDGLPDKFTWKDLKDEIRKDATHGVWTSVEIRAHGQHTVPRHFVRAKRQDEAVAAYTHFATRAIAGTRPRVELWDITPEAVKFLHRNYRTAVDNQASQLRGVDRLAQDNSLWTPIASGYPSTFFQFTIPATSQASQPYIMPQVPATSMPPAFSAAQMAQWHAHQLALAQQAIVQQQRSSNPQYAVNSASLPVNATNGVAITEQRAVFVGNICYKTKDSELEKLFGEAGTIVSCKIQRDSSSRKSNGNATIEFSSAEEAEQAIRRLDGRELDNRKLSVRLNKDTKTVALPQSSEPRPGRPVIVDSSMGRRSSAHNQR